MIVYTKNIKLFVLNFLLKINRFFFIAVMQTSKQLERKSFGKTISLRKQQQWVCFSQWGNIGVFSINSESNWGWTSCTHWNYNRFDTQREASAIIDKAAFQPKLKCEHLYWIFRKKHLLLLLSKLTKRFLIRYKSCLFCTNRFICIYYKRNYTRPGETCACLRNLP